LPPFHFMVNTTKLIPKKLRKILYPFQRKSMRQIYKFNKRVLIADEMGLGKTLQAITFLSMENEHFPALIVCPASVKYNWKKEIIKWMPEYETWIQVAEGRKPKVVNSILIINYDILNYWKDELAEYIWKTIILDECHKIKNEKAKRTKAVQYLVKNIRYIIGLTGTPIENHPIDIYMMLKLLRPNLFSNKWKFGQRYCDLKHDGFGWNYNGHSNIEELHSILINQVMLRRKKEDVLKDLPDKSINTIFFDVDLKEYNQCRNNYVSWFVKEFPEKSHLMKDKKFNKKQIMAKLSHLKRLAVEAKYDIVVKWIDDFLESGKKLLIFAHHVKIIESLAVKYRCDYINGSASSEKRDKIVEKFQTKSDVQVFSR
jgi:SWI/SNF-related matrix-associated actin-dependent regulator 1 of chromatin subfamily A